MSCWESDKWDAAQNFDAVIGWETEIQPAFLDRTIADNEPPKDIQNNSPVQDDEAKLTGFFGFCLLAGEHGTFKVTAVMAVDSFRYPHDPDLLISSARRVPLLRKTAA